MRNAVTTADRTGEAVNPSATAIIARSNIIMSVHPALDVDPDSVEWYTPLNIIEAARQAMGPIDLDPASCYIANLEVGASKYYTNLDNGLVQMWHGNVWMNHPYGRGRNRKWVERVVEAYESGEIAQACVLTYAATGTKWYRPLLDYPICFIYGRTHFLRPDGTTGPAQKDTSVTYFGKNVEKFRAAFSEIGRVKA